MKQRTINDRANRKYADSLFAAVLSLESRDECRAFFTDLCTPAELEAMADRWRVVKLLMQEQSYRAIAAETGVSLVTIGRVAKCLHGNDNGYRLVLEKMGAWKMLDPARLRIAVQKSGRLAEPSLGLLERCGIRFTKSKDQLFCQSKNFAADLLMLRDDDIPELVHESACDLGIVGLNVFNEKSLEHAQRKKPFAMEKIADLGFGFCRLSLAVPKEAAFADRGQLSGKKIATSYPATVQAWLDRYKISATVVEMSGAIEIAPRLQIADVVCDLVSTGETLAANGLREIETIAESQSILIRRVNNMSPAKEQLIQRLLSRLQGVMKAEESKYIMLHCPVASLDKVRAALPGVESPTILPLQGVTDKVAIHAVCRENLFWETMEDLKAAGASAILVLPIEKILE